MKGIVTIFVLSFGLLFSGCDANNKTDNNDIDQQQNNIANNEDNIISKQQALEIALLDANLTQDQVQLLNCELDHDDNQKDYDIEFSYQDTKYEYEIDAINGNIISKEQESNYA